jgi:ankyrin repeat protein
MTISRFRWVFCQLQELKKLRSTREQSIEAALRSLPVGLNATYKRMLDRIDNHDRKEAVAMLNWLSFALHTLTLGELQEARLINPDNGGSVAWDDPGSIEDIVEILGDLIHIEEPFDVTTPGVRWKSKEERDWIAYDSYRNYVKFHGGNPSNDTFYLDDVPSSDRTDLYNAWCKQEGRQFARIRLAHFSVKEYLVSAHVGLSLFHELPFHGPTSQRSLAQSCLAYLCNYSKRSESSWSAQDNATYPLLNYAVHNWVSHANGHASGHPDGYDATALPNEIALLRDCKAREDWLRAKHGIYNSADDALYCACELGHRACVEELLRLGEPVNIVGEQGLSQSALQIASETGHLEIVKLLVGAGGDVNWISTKSYDLRTTALYKAAFEGHEEIVAVLLKAGASIQPVMHPQHPGFGTSALHAASARGHTNIVKRLLNAGSDVDLSGCVEPLASMASAPAIQVASAGGHEAVVSALIDAGANVNASGQLAGAINVTFPCTVPIGTEPFSTALLAAAANGHTEVARRLIIAGADLNVVGCTEIVVASAPIEPSMLIAPSRGSATYAPMISALYTASLNGHGEIVSILLDAGADLNAISYPSTDHVATPICAAAEAGDLGIVATLLAAGADISKSTMGHRHPLIAAVENSHVEVVAALIEVGAEVNTRSDTVSALGVAAAKGNVRIVEILIEAGAYSNVDDYHGHTALMIASAEGRIEVIKALIDAAAGQPANMPGFEEAVNLAAIEGHSDIEQLLLDQLMLSQLI